MSPNAVASHSQLLTNGQQTNPDCIFGRQLTTNKAVLWKIGNDKQSMIKDFTASEMKTALKSLKLRKSPGLDQIHPEFLFHIGKNATAWLHKFLSFCLQNLNKIGQKLVVVAIWNA